MAPDRECILWCPVCKVDKFEIVREPAYAEGVCHHRRRSIESAIGVRPKDTKSCEKCGTDLARKPDG